MTRTQRLYGFGKSLLLAAFLLMLLVLVRRIEEASGREGRVRARCVVLSVLNGEWKQRGKGMVK